MGVGKTSIGKRLAARLEIAFVDADEEIEKAAGLKVTHIFATLGESGFRDGEQRVIARLLDDQPKVLATGGGAMTHEKTRGLLKDRAVTLWLKTDLSVIARRVANRPHRPLLKDRDPMQVLQQQALERYPLFEQADIIVETGDQSHKATVDLVLNALKAYVELKK